jgi:DNA (cytosine-5)-methyltransferase 1
MSVTCYYNEIDPKAAAVLRQLIAAGLIAPGDVDERSIEDVKPSDLAGYTQCHFFAGYGVWSYALRLAGWPDDREVWTGSCPCQPFSAAGKGAGFDDERHLWPHMHWLIQQCRPAGWFGEQVASKDGLGWLDLVQADLEAEGYAVGGADLCAAGFGAPHIRQRLYIAAVRLDDAIRTRLEGHIGDERHFDRPGRISANEAGSVAEAGATHGLAFTDGDGCQSRGEGRPALGHGEAVDAGCGAGGLEHADSVGRIGRETTAPGHDDDWAASERAQSEHGLGIASAHRLHQHGAGPTNGFWRDADWLFCRDGKWRPVQPGTFPLVDGAPARVGRLRGYGNAIVAQVAAEFIKATAEVTGER